MPADARVENRGASRRDLMAQRYHLFDRRAALNQIDHRQAKNDDEITAHGLAHLANNFDR